MDDYSGWWLDEYDLPRFLASVNRNGGRAHEEDPLATAEGDCWTWTGAQIKGYGSFSMGKKTFLAHRVAYLDGGRKNRIPEGYVVDHLCRNTLCVNPRHLEPITFDENVARGLRGTAARPNCPSGHPFDEENTKYVKRNDRTIRVCRTCLKASRQRSRLKRLKAAA